MSDILQASKVHVDRHLSNVAQNYMPEGFVAQDIAPIVPVGKRTDTFINYSQADIYRRESAIRMDGDEAKIVKFGAGSDSYRCLNYALRSQITLEDEANRDPEYRMLTEEGRVRFLRTKHDLDWETRVASLCLNTANVASNFGADSSWTDYTNSNPLRNIWTAQDNFRNITGYRANKMVIGVDAWENLVRNTNVRNSVMNPNVSAGGDLPMAPAVARYLGLEKILVAGTYRNFAGEGVPNSLGVVWGDSLVLYRAPNNPSIEEPSWMYSFRWSAPGIPQMQVERHPYDTRRKCYDIELGYHQDEKITNSTFAFMIRNCNSAN